MVGQITPGEFHWQDANYDRDSALGRELLFLIADNKWVRATSETIDISRSDTIETYINIDIDFDRIARTVGGGRPGRQHRHGEYLYRRSGGPRSRPRCCLGHHG
jgi:hypothetical protein